MDARLRREEVFPLETLDLTYDQVLQVIGPSRSEVKARASGRPTCRPSSAAWASARCGWA